VRPNEMRVSRGATLECYRMASTVSDGAASLTRVLGSAFAKAPD
jgi:hypothetical protein